jgi:hypothetical protein
MVGAKYQMKPTSIKVVAIKRGRVMWPSNIEPDPPYYEMSYFMKLRVGLAILILEGVAVGGWEPRVNSVWNGNIYRYGGNEDDFTASPQVFRVIDADGTFDDSYSVTEHVEFVCLAPIAVGDMSAEWPDLTWVRHDIVPEWNEAAEELKRLDEEIVLEAISQNAASDFSSLAAQRAELVAACTAIRVAVEDKLQQAIEQKIPEILQPDPIHWWHKLEKSGIQPITDVPLLAGECNDTCLIVWRAKRQPDVPRPTDSQMLWVEEYTSYRCVAYPDEAAARKALSEAMGSEPQEHDVKRVWDVVKDLHDFWQDGDSDDWLDIDMDFDTESGNKKEDED